MPYTGEKSKEYQKKWYQENKDRHKSLARDRRRGIREWFDEFKKTLQCEVCGENCHVCLDFHHKDPTEKEIDLADAIWRGCAKETILAEVEKCEVLCANCHRKHHAGLLVRPVNETD